jgi:hypothetical protein
MANAGVDWQGCRLSWTGLHLGASRLHVDASGLNLSLLRFVVQLVPPGTDPAELVPSPTGSVRQITGTPLYAPLSILCGEPHTESSMLEGLFISLLDRCSDGKLVDRHDMDFTDLPRAQRARRGSLTGARLGELDHIPAPLQSFIQSLHDLFYPMAPSSRVLRKYRTDVRFLEVHTVCRRYNENVKDL